MFPASDAKDILHQSNVSEILQEIDIVFFSESVSCGAAWNNGMMDYWNNE
jgi:hypothetical protein